MELKENLKIENETTEKAVKVDENITNAEEAELNDKIAKITELLEEQVKQNNEIDKELFKIFMVMICMFIINIIALTLTIVFSLA